MKQAFIRREGKLFNIYEGMTVVFSSTRFDEAKLYHRTNYPEHFNTSNVDSDSQKVRVVHGHQFEPYAYEYSIHYGGINKYLK